MAAAAKSETVFTASSGVLFHEKDVRFTHDQERQPAGAPLLYSFTAADAATVQKVRDLAAAEPQWGIREVTS